MYDLLGKSALHYAAICPDIVCIKLLLEVTSNTNLRSSSGVLALTHTAWDGCGREVIACFIEEGANPNSADEQGCTALHAATYGDHAVTVTALLDFGADINVCDNDGDAVLH